MEADPRISQRLKDNADRLEKRTRASNAALEPAVREANELGYPGDTIEGILKLNAPLDRPPVKVLLTALSTLGMLGPREQESIVRALGAAEHIYDASPLVDLFNRTRDHALKWAIVNTFALTRPRGIKSGLVRYGGLIGRGHSQDS